jgi:hypothetical protein
MYESSKRFWFYPTHWERQKAKGRWGKGKGKRQKAKGRRQKAKNQTSEVLKTSEARGFPIFPSVSNSLC